MAILTAIVLAGCPAAQGVSKPTVSEQIADISSLAVGAAPRSISLGSAFDGEELVFSASTSNPSVAGASIAGNRSVVVGAIGPGRARITVTATNAGGSASQSFNVTVPQTRQEPVDDDDPTDEDDPADQTPTPQEDCSLSGSSLSITIEVIRDASQKCVVPEGHVLQYDDDGVQAHHIEGNTWTITAKLKGSHVVHLINELDGTRPGSITVIVPNTAPTLRASAAVMSIGTDDTDPAAPTAESLIAATTPVDDTLLTNSIDPGRHFEDADTADNAGDPARGNFRFRIFEKPDEVLIRTHRGFIAVRVGDTDTYDSRLTST